MAPNATRARDQNPSNTQKDPRKGTSVDTPERKAFHSDKHKNNADELLIEAVLALEQTHDYAKNQHPLFPLLVSIIKGTHKKRESFQQPKIFEGKNVGTNIGYFGATTISFLTPFIAQYAGLAVLNRIEGTKMFGNALGLVLTKNFKTYGAGMLGNLYEITGNTVRGTLITNFVQGAIQGIGPGVQTLIGMHISYVVIQYIGSHVILHFYRQSIANKDYVAQLWNDVRDDRISNHCESAQSIQGILNKLYFAVVVIYFVYNVEMTKTILDITEGATQNTSWLTSAVDQVLGFFSRRYNPPPEVSNSVTMSPFMFGATGVYGFLQILLLYHLWTKLAGIHKNEIGPLQASIKQQFNFAFN
jgi:hypothetical protein